MQGAKCYLPRIRHIYGLSQAAPTYQNIFTDSRIRTRYLPVPARALPTERLCQFEILPGCWVLEVYWPKYQKDVPLSKLDLALI